MRIWVQSLASLSGLRIQHCCSCGVGSRGGSDLALLWPRYRPAVAAPIQPLVCELLCATGAAVKKEKKKKKKKKEKKKKGSGYQGQDWTVSSPMDTSLKLRSWAFLNSDAKEQQNTPLSPHLMFCVSFFPKVFPAGFTLQNWTGFFSTHTWRADIIYIAVSPSVFTLIEFEK